MTHHVTFPLTIAIVMFSSVCSLADEDVMSLFDGTTLNGWQRADGKPITDGWEVVQGMIHLKTGGRRGGDIVTEQEFRDFDLQFEWKITEKGNNGVKYRVRKYGNSMLGCEYQILDDAAYGEQLKGKGSTGSLYEVYEPNEAKALNPPGEFNQGRIVVWGNHIEHWLNGRLIVSAEAGSPEWDRRIAESKFAKYEGFGQNRSGKIMLTDHNSEVWFRNVTLRVLPAPETMLAATKATQRGSCRLMHGPRRKLASNLFAKLRQRCGRRK
jgi:hypothetical protein